MSNFLGHVILMTKERSDSCENFHTLAQNSSNPKLIQFGFCLLVIRNLSLDHITNMHAFVEELIAN